MPTLTDWELWAVAAKVVEAEGDDVGQFLTERISSLTQAGDADGVATWLAIADRIQQLFYGRPDDPSQIN